MIRRSIWVFSLLSCLALTGCSEDWGPDQHGAQVTAQQLDGQWLVINYWAEWCGPCRMIAPSVEAIAEEYDGKAGFYKMNVDENMNVPQRYGIRGIPTLILFKNGEEQERIVGAVSKDAIAKVVGKYV